MSKSEKTAQDQSFTLQELENAIAKVSQLVIPDKQGCCSGAKVPALE